MRNNLYLCVLASGILLVSLIPLVPPADAYVEAPMSLGAVVAQSSNIMVLRVDKVDKAENRIIFTKVRDLKGKHPQEVVKHNIGKGGFHPREWQYIMEWAEVGKTAIFFHNGGASETCIGNYWYQMYAAGDWWGPMTHGEPFLLRSFAGKTDKLASAVTAMLEGKEVIVPCMVDGNKQDLQERKAKVQRLKVSLKLQDYNPKRDFAGWGAEDFRVVEGMPGFTHYSATARVDPDAQAVSVTDINEDGKPDLCLIGASRLALLQNDGEAFGEMALPVTGGARAVVWADYNADGKVDALAATPKGPKLLTNLGTGQFRDDSHLLPVAPAYNLTAAAWIDHDGDGRPDLLLGNGFHGLRLYRNKGKPADDKTPLKLGDWHHIGPFDNAGGKGFFTAYPPETEFDLAKKYAGKSNKQVGWVKANFKDGAINNLALFEPQNNQDAVIYLYRQIDSNAARDLPISLGSDDSLTVFLNGQKVLAENVARPAAVDQNQLVLKLNAGKNDLLLKIGQSAGEWAFYFALKEAQPPAVTWEFEDVSESVGLGPDGIAGMAKGDSLTVCDFDGDHRPDFLYGAGSGLLVRNTGKGFAVVPDSGLSFKPGKVGPAVGDFDNDGKPGLFVPQDGACKLYRSLGAGKFEDVSAKSGDLAQPIERATCAAWGDFDNDGHLDLFVGCLLGANRYFRNKGNGAFEEQTSLLGLHQKIFNTQALAVADLNRDGCLDLVLVNEGQDSAVLLGRKKEDAKHVPVVIKVATGSGVIGSEVTILDGAGKVIGKQCISGGEGRGGQAGPFTRFLLLPGKYTVAVRSSAGESRGQELSVGSAPLFQVVDDKSTQLK